MSVDEGSRHWMESLKSVIVLVQAISTSGWFVAAFPLPLHEPVSIQDPS